MAVANDDGLQSFDLISLGGMLRVCELEMVLLGEHGPRACVDSLAMNEAIICSGEADFPFRGRFVLPSGWCVLGYIHEAPEGSWCHGTPLAANMAFAVFPEGISEFMLRAGSRISMVLLPLERLQSRFTQLEPHQAEMPTRLLALFNLSGDRQAQALRAHFENIQQNLPKGLLSIDGSSASASINLLIESYLMAGLSALAEDRPQCSRGRRAHYLVVQRTEDYMRRNLRHDIYITEMCNAAGVSERALRYAFDDLLGVSPNRYLSMLRLCIACKSLSLSDASRRSVKSVALSCGLWDLSRFADHYRRVFGELPRDTLMRAPRMEAMSG
ncbi:helix-turn-helix domain-containing protein [Dyella sp. 20L07]|uniref:AraC family transcriptional regulator n=1 Tax=Dyella sp. 20L07 TaxID=3384240 RepID=UPI003D27A378